MSLDERHHDWQQTPGGMAQCAQCGVYYGQHQSIDCPNPPAHVGEIDRLRTLLDDLLRAVEPFAEGLKYIDKIGPSMRAEYFASISVTGKFGETELRSLVEAFLKAKGG